MQANRTQGQSPKTDLELELARSFFEQQRQKHLLEEKEIEFQSRIAELSLKYQAEYFKNLPNNKRKMIITQGVIITILVVLFLTFLAYILKIGKDDFANKVIVFFTHATTLIAGISIGNQLQFKKRSAGEVEGFIHSDNPQ